VDVSAFLTHIHAFCIGLAYAQPRILAMFAILPIFNPQIVPGMIRLGIASSLGLLVAPSLMQAAVPQLSLAQWMFVMCKEAFVGFTIGFALALPFWAFEGIGFLVDNQRGASISATLSPLTGNDSSPLGLLFNQAFIVFFFLCGGFPIILQALYDSFRLWPVFDWTPTLHPETMPLVLAQLDAMVRLAVLFAAPVTVAMFLAELGLALISRFVPQLQVFFIAMPVKSALAFFVLIVYGATLFDWGRESIGDLRLVIPALDQQWGAAERGR
jgi:type III secretion protein T